MKWRSLAVLVALVALIWVLWPTPNNEQNAIIEPSQVPRKTAPKPSAAGTQDSFVPVEEGLPRESPPPALDRVMTASDGALEVLVLAGETFARGAKITLYWRGERDPNLGTYPFANAGSTQTGKDGRARLFAKRGHYVVVVKHEDYATTTVEAHRPSDEPITKVTISLQRGSELRGETVREEDNAPVALVEVTLTPGINVPRSETLRARSDARGLFTLNNVAPGEYDIDARKEGEGSGSLRRVALPAGQKVIVKLGASSFLNGYVQRANGAPAEGALVTAIGGRQPTQVTSGRGGAFAIEAPRGDYTLQALLGDETGATTERIHLGSGKTVDGLQIKLGAPASISGRVIDVSTNEPVMDASIDVSPYRENGDSGRARTDADGRFVVKPLAPGSYDVVVQAEGYSLKQKRGITLAHGEQFELPLQITRPGKISGAVVDEENNGVVGATVSISGADTQTAEQGRFSFEGVTPGTVSIRAWKQSENLARWERVMVKSGESATARIVLPASATLEVSIVDEANNVVTAGQFSLEPLKGPGYVRKTLDGSASYTMSIPSGIYRVVMRPAGTIDLAGKSEPVTLEPAAQKSVTLVVKPSGLEAIAGIVLGVDGTPQANASIRLEPSEGSAQTYWNVTGTDGRFVVRKPNKQVAYTAKAWDNTWHTSIRVPAEGEVILRLRPNGGLIGTVQGRREGETLRIDYDSDTADQSLEFAGGTFSFRDVPAADDATVRVVSSLGRKAEAKQFRVSPGEITQIVLTLE